MAVGLNHRDTRFLLCSICREYLSCGPVYTIQERHSVCGRCSKSNTDGKGMRNRYYEVAAKNLRFPCMYMNFGCTESQLFAENYTMSHEYSCEFKTYRCVFWENYEEPCPYINLKTKLAEHVQTKHPGKLLNNCCRLDLKFNRSSERTYLLLAFEMQFLLYVRVTMTLENRKVEFGLELLGNQKAASEFEYTINISKDRSMVTKIGACQVLPNRSEINFDNLKDLFGDLRDVTIHFTVSVKCFKCENELLFGRLYNELKVWYCSKCAPQLTFCENRAEGCRFQDHPIKISKHEEYYCRFTDNLIGIPILKCGRIWKVKKDSDICAFVTDVGMVVCEFTSVRNCEKFELFIWSPLRYDQQRDFDCRVNVGNPLSGDSVILHPIFNVYKDYDWYVSIDKKDHPSWGAEIAVFVCVQRKMCSSFLEKVIAMIL